jgi:serine/threonine-protein kinase
MCPDDRDLALFLDGLLPETRRDAVESHLDACADCCQVLGAAARSATAPVDASSDRTLSRGDTVGRYLIVSLLGQGAMGRVYAAYDPELDRRVALKLLRRTRGSAGVRRLLLREARGLGRLSHPNVVQVHDVGEHDGHVFVAMELVDGGSLDRFCRGSPAPGWREVLTAYLDAVRGLMAAHAKGLVHRDVKPANILRGTDGRVRVADFGLVLGHGGDEDAGDGAARGALEDRLTATGAIVGTPLYMAPEQHRSASTTAASDQYSLCAALYEGLYGAPPFLAPPGSSLDALLTAKEVGPPASPPEGSGVPAWVYRALSRGLAPDPEDRYPSLDALRGALEDDPEIRARSRRLRLAGVAVTVLIGASLAFTAKSGYFRDPCAHPEAELAGIWDDGVAREVKAAFLATGRPYAEGTVTRVAALLDRHRSEWVAMHREVCEASRDAAHDLTLLRLRDACLDQRRGELRALTTLFAESSDPEVLDRAVPASAGLRPIASCADTEALAARVRPPDEPTLRAQVAALRPRVDRMKALLAAGKNRAAGALGRPLLADAEKIPYPPIRAEVEVWLALALEREGDYGDYQEPRALYQDAAVAAGEGKDDLLAARAWAGLFLIVGERQHKLAEAALIYSLGAGVVARADDDEVAAFWANSEGAFLARISKLPEARAANERSVALREKALGPDHPATASYRTNLGMFLCHDLDECAAARRPLERAVATYEKALGPDHPETLNALGTLASTLRRLGMSAEARALNERILAVREHTLSPEHFFVFRALHNLGLTVADLGDYPRAAELLSRALALKEKTLGPRNPIVQSSRIALGRTLVHLGRLGEARPLLEQALHEVEAGSRAGEDLTEALLGLGELHLALRSPRDAVPFLERATSRRDPEFHAGATLTLAEALWQIGEDRSRARALAEESRANAVRRAHGPDTERATRWLANHPDPR